MYCNGYTGMCATRDEMGRGRTGASIKMKASVGIGQSALDSACAHTPTHRNEPLQNRHSGGPMAIIMATIMATVMATTPPATIACVQCWQDQAGMLSRCAWGLQVRALHLGLGDRPGEAIKDCAAGLNIRLSEPLLHHGEHH